MLLVLVLSLVSSPVAAREPIRPFQAFTVTTAEGSMSVTVGFASMKRGLHGVGHTRTGRVFFLFHVTCVGLTGSPVVGPDDWHVRIAGRWQGPSLVPGLHTHLERTVLHPGQRVTGWLAWRGPLAWWRVHLLFRRGWSMGAGAR